MVSPISDTAAVSPSAGVTNRGSCGSGSGKTEESISEVVKQVSSESEDAHASSEVKKAGVEKPVQRIKALTEGEVRKTEVKDGEVITKVYDSRGKLLRETPPGPLPKNGNIYITI